ncbi:MAG TPA: conjugal transfer protein TrbF [Sphingomonas sp.]|uniref:conjugal transfer protein TrbF n=1 Tax=Sphingomonas sp. TaxID=28214 RepID=UPI002B9E685E|nr:conjugal transfer protein TrbF [Sphingomonas sp.]HMI19379.1 conjugal transfer protein TrbF [Sphingomonas sp.]
MIFRRSIQRYGQTPPAETPFHRAGQIWDERIGSARVQARNWRLIAFGTLGLSGAMAGGLVWQSQQSRIVPYVVEVDHLGEPRAVNAADAKVRATDPQIAWGLARFVEDVRAVSLDPVLMRRQWLRAYDFVTERGAQFLGDYARRAEPFAHIGEHSASVEVTSVVRASDRTFEVKWVESTFERGVRTSLAHWTAFVTVEIRPPATADTLRRNPLGLYVDGISWSRELDAARPGPASPSSPSGAVAAPLPQVPTTEETLS